jgi:hypothetical protein
MERHRRWGADSSRGLIGRDDEVSRSSWSIPTWWCSTLVGDSAKIGTWQPKKIEMSVISVRSEKRKHGKCCHPTKPPLSSLPVNSPSLNGYMAYQACQEGLFFPFIFNFGYLHVFAFYETGAVQSLAFGVLR